MVNVPIDEFKEKWYLKDYGEEIYTNGSLQGTINYEDDNFIVIKLTK
jgi:preprotein translocase subunit YajC